MNYAPRWFSIHVGAGLIKLATFDPISMDFIALKLTAHFWAHFDTMEVIVPVDRLIPRRLPSRTWIRIVLTAP